MIGAGISGLSAVWLLARSHEVVLFDREPRAGGHANTARVPTADGDVPVDTGFIVFNEATYPGFSAMLRALGVPTQPAEMSFGCRCDGCGLQYSSRGAAGFFARRSAMVRLGHWRLLAELRGFFADARRRLESGIDDGLTLGGYLAGRGSELRGHFLVPLAAAVWSTAPAEVLDFPLLYLLRFLDNHGLIGFGRAVRWRTITGGSNEYVRRVLATLPPGSIRLGDVVRSVRPVPGNAIEVATAGGTNARFDAAVIATHADEALRLLHAATSAQRRALETFRYTTNRVVLHTDTSTLPGLRDARASWNVSTAGCQGEDRALSMTYDLSRLQSIPGPERFLVSVNPRKDLDPRRVVSEHAYSHPSYGPETLAAQRRVADIQGLDGVYFAGAHLGYGFHEDGHRSGASVAARLSRMSSPAGA